jgi:putative ABC transport system permease protein
MTQVGPSVDWRLAVAIALLMAIAVGAATLGRMPTGRRSAVAVVRAVVQLAVVAGVIRLALEHVWSAALFVVVMLAVATFTSAGRVEARDAWPWVALAISTGVAPVVVVVFGTGSTPVNPPAVVAICGIVVGNAMTACSLAVRRAIASLREQHGQVEAAMALGLTRPLAIALVIDRGRPEALVPVLDQTRTVGLVTLPGAFVGVLLGGGSTADAAAAQIIVLAGLIAADTITVIVASRLVAAGRILPTDVREQLPSA